MFLSFPKGTAGHNDKLDVTMRMMLDARKKTEGGHAQGDREILRRPGHHQCEFVVAGLKALRVCDLSGNAVIPKNMTRWCAALLIGVVSALAQPAALKQVPPPGVDVPAQDRAELEAGLRALRAAADKVRGNPLLPDVLIYQEAVRYALQYNEFFKPDEIAKAKALLQRGDERAPISSPRAGALALRRPGLCVRGYISKIDKSVQPYGLVVPASYAPRLPHRWRLDAWFHGRNENAQRGELPGRPRAQPGRVHAARHHRAASLRTVLQREQAGGRGGSVRSAGGREAALCHRRESHPGARLQHGRRVGVALRYALRGTVGGGRARRRVQRDCGVSEAEADGPNAPTWWEQKLFHLYDATDYAVNLANTPVVAYNGEIDRTEAGRRCNGARVCRQEGLRLRVSWGRTRRTAIIPIRRWRSTAFWMRSPNAGAMPYPRKVRFTTWTLAYNQMKWVTVDALGKHWERARLNAEIEGDDGVSVDGSNVTAFTLEMGPGGCPLDLAKQSDGGDRRAEGAGVVPMSRPLVDGAFPQVGRAMGGGEEYGGRRSAQASTGCKVPWTMRSWTASSLYRRRERRSRRVSQVGGRRGEARDQGMARQFRGEAQVRDDTEITDADIAASNLVLWGDPGSNRVLARIADRLPLKMDRRYDRVAGRALLGGTTHAPILIYPNPLNPKKYVVLNSGFTFREFDYLNNARQTPKLPDYAVVDMNSAPGPAISG